MKKACVFSIAGLITSFLNPHLVFAEQNICQRNVLSQNSTSSVKLGQIKDPPTPMSVWLGVYPGPITSDSKGNIYVADQVNRRIVKYSSTGAAVHFVNLEKDNDVEGDYIAAIATDNLDQLYVVNDEKSTVNIYAADGKKVNALSYLEFKMFNSARGIYVSGFHPERMSIDRDGKIYLYKRGYYKEGGVIDRNGRLVDVGVAVNFDGIGLKNHNDEKMVGYSGYYYKIAGGNVPELRITDRNGVTVARCSMKGIAPADRSNLDVTHMDRNGNVYLVEHGSLDLIRLTPGFDRKINSDAENRINNVNIHYYLQKLYTDDRYRIQEEKSEKLNYLKKMGPSDIRKLRNTIFARKNYIFKDQNLTTYFKETFPDYIAQNHSIQLSGTDKDNIQYLLEIEKQNRTK